jgi:PqqA peptide cyclase
VLQVHLSGGEPAARRDIVEITAAAHRASLCTNLITSAVGLTEKKPATLAEASLDHVQISIQDADAPRRAESVTTRAPMPANALSRVKWCAGTDHS